MTYQEAIDLLPEYLKRDLESPGGDPRWAEEWKALPLEDRKQYWLDGASGAKKAKTRQAGLLRSKDLRRRSRADYERKAEAIKESIKFAEARIIAFKALAGREV